MLTRTCNKGAFTVIILTNLWIKSSWTFVEKWSEVISQNLLKQYVYKVQIKFREVILAQNSDPSEFFYNRIQMINSSMHKLLFDHVVRENCFQWQKSIDFDLIVKSIFHWCVQNRCSDNNKVQLLPEKNIHYRALLLDTIGCLRNRQYLDL